MRHISDGGVLDKLLRRGENNAQLHQLFAHDLEKMGHVRESKVQKSLAQRSFRFA